MITSGLFILVILVVALIAFISSIRHPSGRVGDPICGHCGYSTIGLERMICPECGSDLRRVGIVGSVPQTSVGRIVGLMIGFTFAISLLAGLSTQLLELVVPQRVAYSATTTLTTPASGAFGGVGIQVDERRLAGRGTPLPVKAFLTPTPGRTKELQVDVGSGAYQYIDSNGRIVNGRAELGRTFVLEWLRALGVDTANPQVVHEAGRIAAEIQHAGRITSLPIGWRGQVRRALGDSDFANQDRFISVNVSPLLDDRLALFWWALWACGLWAIARLARRARGAPALQDESPPNKPAQET